MIQVPSLTLPQVEQRANVLLGEYADTIGSNVPSPVPVTDIATNELGLTLEFMDLHAYFKRPKSGASSEILGAMEFSNNRILIDHSLDPSLFPHRLGRFRYSVAHEIGHWRLHRGKVLQSQKKSKQPPIICRDPGRQKMPTIERQAEYFASFLLLPGDRVSDAWGSKPPFVFDVFGHGSPELRSLWMSTRADSILTRSLFASECEKRFEEIAAPLAWKFEVSKQAMCIRLEGMGLIRRSAAGSKILSTSRGDFLHSPMNS
ncbi:MAG: ImmA/IrrE family metallo-endopeptidase [Reyranella sp.]|uniref:ImmA/IrrE family metallo-endopeptidase n=1 Tax=Reyranella sp. TaxID=1929291 RepID=UPI0012073F18|nr:ImmA/IrrE family metallo-endopeptidase [Reyranella sp.]TAJ96854.1 MAG: ImmA/IrrE family metallo-endopeptidase [Reyranella sp.]TBR22665.1 MAG: ImmA/IrrE family metallo-endopeptidase [Reyranella sp.]